MSKEITVTAATLRQVRELAAGVRSLAAPLTRKAREDDEALTWGEMQDVIIALGRTAAKVEASLEAAGKGKGAGE